MRRNFLRTLAIAALLVIGVEAHAVQLVNRSFEQGNLTGWDYIGDVSAQTADLGVTPTHGQYAALLGTSYAGTGETSFSGTFAVGWPEVAQFLGLGPPYTSDGQPAPDWLAFFTWAQATGAEFVGFTESAIRQSVELRAGDVLSFDWNFVSDDVDSAWALFYPTSSPIWEGGTYTALHPMFAPVTNPTNMDLGAYDPRDCGASSYFCKWETGWQSSYFVAPSDGEYSVAFGIFSNEDPGYLSALWLDNFKIGKAPEPSTLALLGLGLAGLAFTRRRRQ